MQLIFKIQCCVDISYCKHIKNICTLESNRNVMKPKMKVEPAWVQRNRQRSRERYHRLKDENHLILIADMLLKSLSKKYGLDVFIPVEKFTEVDFPFGVSTGYISKYSRFDIVVDKFCYSYFTNQTIKINMV